MFKASFVRRSIRAIDQEIFDHKILDIRNDFQKYPKFSIALSGGSDSMALAALCYKFHLSQPLDLSAFIVDHGVRKESHDEATKIRNIIMSKYGNSKTISDIR